MNAFIKYYEDLQALEKNYREKPLEHLNISFQKDELADKWGIDENERSNMEYVHHTALNLGYREGYALAIKNSIHVLEVTTELLRRSEERVTELEEEKDVE